MAGKEIHIEPVAELPGKAFIRALNAAYADYFVPIHLTEQSFKDLVARESVDLEASAAALCGRRIVGMGLLGVRGRRAWIGGMGVLPTYRRRGIGRRVMCYLLEQARRHGLVTIQLEVITHNDSAYHLYRSLGFETTRRLLIVSREPRPLPGDFPALPPGINIVHWPPDDLLDCLSSFPSVTRPWQRETASFQSTSALLDGLAAIDEAGEQLVGAFLYSGGAFQIGIADLVATTPEIGGVLLAHLLEYYPAAYLSYINVAEDDPMLPILNGAGFAESLAQYEMHLCLNQEPLT
jgi:ribosomal protein S18 acetylase RimI-like enzyme